MLNSLSVEQRMHNKQMCNFTEATNFVKNVDMSMSVKHKLVNIFFNCMKDVKSEKCWISVQDA